MTAAASEASSGTACFREAFICYRPCKIAQKWPSKMSDVDRVTERWLRRGVRVSMRVPGGFHTMASPPNGGDAMIGRETRVLLRHYLEQGMSKAAIARQVGISPRTVYRWIAAGQLDRELDDAAVRYGPRRFAALEARSVQRDHRRPFGRVSGAQRRSPVQRSPGSGLSGRLRPGEALRARGPAPAPGGAGAAVRNPSGPPGQVDFAEFRLPWGKRYALIVVLGYSRLVWVQYYDARRWRW